MKRSLLPLFSKFINLKLDIPVKIDNSQFFVRMDLDKKNDIVNMSPRINITNRVHVCIYVAT